MATAISWDNTEISPYDTYTAKLREQARKRYIASMHPVCSRCSKPGPDCRNRDKCNARRLKLALKGCDAKHLQGVALPAPPEAWIVARGYGTMSNSYHSGGRRKYGGRDRLHMRHGTDRVSMRQHYAYDLAMGVSWEDDATLAA